MPTTPCPKGLASSTLVSLTSLYVPPPAFRCRAAGDGRSRTLTEPLPSHLSKLRSSPLVGELTSLFDTIENDRLADWLSTPITRRGPKGNTTKALLRITLASYYLSHDSLSDTVRELQNNLTLANWCLEGAEVPSRSTLSSVVSRN